MEITAKSHIPTCSFGFIECEYSFVEGSKEDFHKMMVKDFKNIQRYWKEESEIHVTVVNNVLVGERPTKLGQTLIENGHTYKSQQNEKTKEFFWLIENV